MPAPTPRRARAAGVLGSVPAVLAGSTMALQSRANALLGERVGDPVGAAFASILVGLVVVVAATVLLPSGRRGLRALPGIVREGRLPWWFLLAGVVGAVFVLAQTTAAGALGVAVLLLAVVVGQSLGGLAVDRWGIGPAGVRMPTVPRVLGTVLVLGAAALAVFPRVGAERDSLVLVLLPLLAGILMPVQAAMNGRIGMAVGTPITPTLTNFVAAVAALGVATAVYRAAADPPDWSWPGPFWLWLGGPLGVLFVGAVSVLARRIGVLQTSLGVVAGMLLGGLAVDVALPAPGTVVEPLTVAGTLLTLVGLGVASWPGRPRPAPPAG